jgi:hypothetical protein
MGVSVGKSRHLVLPSIHKEAHFARQSYLSFAMQSDFVKRIVVDRFRSARGTRTIRAR